MSCVEIRDGRCGVIVTDEYLRATFALRPGFYSLDLSTPEPDARKYALEDLWRQQDAWRFATERLASEPNIFKRFGFWLLSLSMVAMVVRIVLEIQ